MEQRIHTSDAEQPVALVGASQDADVLILCEHASNALPSWLQNLEASQEVFDSHVAWDPGALGVAQALVKPLNAQLVYSTFSRLVYDCNRPPHAPSAILAQSEKYHIPGNANLTPSQRDERAAKIYHPFRQVVEDCLRSKPMDYMVTIHSFTPIYHGRLRDVQIGILHGNDARLATAMLAQKPADMPFETRLNEPYSAADGVAHSLDYYGSMFALPNVMIEIRNDLIATQEQQEAVAAYLAPWIVAASRNLLSAEGGGT